MTDHLTPEKRSWNMSRIKSKNTKPENIVKKILKKEGYLFTANSNTLPGKPDIIIKSLRAVIFVHGCFWHRHKDCRMTTIPKTNTEFWKRKFESNVKRDNKTIKELKKLKWKIRIIWECETGNVNKLKLKLRRILCGIKRAVVQ